MNFNFKNDILDNPYININYEFYNIQLLNDFNNNMIEYINELDQYLMNFIINHHNSNKVNNKDKNIYFNKFFYFAMKFYYKVLADTKLIDIKYLPVGPFININFELLEKIYINKLSLNYNELLPVNSTLVYFYFNEMYNNSNNNNNLNNNNNNSNNNSNNLFIKYGEFCLFINKIKFDGNNLNFKYNYIHDEIIQNVDKKFKSNISYMNNNNNNNKNKNSNKLKKSFIFPDYYYNINQNFKNYNELKYRN